MLRLPPFQYHRPRSLEAAVGLLSELGTEALPVAGGTDLIPNMKHGLFTPRHLVSLREVAGLRGIRTDGDDLVIGSGETLASIATHPVVRLCVPALAEAASQVAGPQLRAMGTLGGNLALDTRCTYYNQTRFWREALGYCLKKDGDVCHVTKVGRKCVAAHSADTPPVLAVLGARVELAGAGGERVIPVRDFFVADGVWNSRRRPGEIITAVRIPLPDPRSRAVYRKLRQRRAIDYPLLTVALGARLEEDGTVSALDGFVTALGSRPRDLAGWEEPALGRRLDGQVMESLAERAFDRCHPLDNITVDAGWRRAMVRVQVRRALEELALPGATPSPGRPAG